MIPYSTQLLLAGFLCLSLSSFSQAKLGDHDPTWTYDYSHFCDRGKVYLTPVKDTLISGLPGKKFQLQYDLYDNCFQQPKAYSTSLGKILIDQGDVVLYYDPIQAYQDTLYDLSLAIGDHWQMYHQSVLAGTDSIFCTVLDTGRWNISGQFLRWQAIEYQAGSLLPFTDTILERVGNLHSFIFIWDRIAMNVDAHSAGNFICYQDSLLAYASDHISCHQSSVQISSLEAGQAQIYPNPTWGKLYLETSLSGPFLFEIRDFSGKLVQSFKGKIPPDIHHLPGGMYLIQVFPFHNQRQLLLEEIITKK